MVKKFDGVFQLLLNTSVVLWFAFQTIQIFASDEIDFKELIAIAEKYDCPQPEGTSELVVGWGGSWRSIGEANSVNSGIYRPAFVIAEPTDEEAIVRMGFAKVTCKSKKNIPPIRPFTLDSPDENKDEYVIEHRHVSSFETAVQLARMGETEMAEKLWKKFSTSRFIIGDHPQEGVQAFLTQPKLLLARGIFEYYKNLTLEPDSDWADILEKLKRLRDEFPELFSDHPERYNEVYRNQFVEDLIFSVEADQPMQNSIHGLLIRYGAGNPPQKLIDDRSVVEILDQGVESIETLVQLTNNRCLTRHVSPQFNNRREYRMRICDLAINLLEEIVGASGPEQSKRSQHWHDWLAETDLSNDKEFFVRASFEKESGKVFATPIIILRNRHLKAFVNLVETVAENAKPNTPYHSLTYAIRDSLLPVKEKTRLLVLLFKNLPKEQKRSAVQALARIDKEMTTELIIPLIDDIPNDVDEPYWTSEAANLTHVVMHLDDVEVWNTYLRKTKQASTGLRMEIMNPFNYSYIGNANVEFRLAFLAEFLDDETIRKKSTTPEKFSGPCAAFTFDEISVRNFVTMKLSSMILEKGVRPDPTWTTKQWLELRQKVRSKLLEYDLPDLLHVGR